MGKMEARPIARLKNHLSDGNLWLYILSLLKKNRKAYAYSLPESINKKFSFSPSRVMIYVVLYKLENEGLIRSEFDERRKYYYLTEKGTYALMQGKKYLADLSRRL